VSEAKERGLERLAKPINQRFHNNTHTYIQAMKNKTEQKNRSTVDNNYLYLLSEPERSEAEFSEGLIHL